MASCFYLFALVLLVVFGQVSASQETSLSPSVSSTNDSIILRAGGASLTLSGCGSSASAGSGNGLPYSPAVTQSDMQAAFASQIQPQFMLLNDNINNISANANSRMNNLENSVIIVFTFFKMSLCYCCNCNCYYFLLGSS